MVEMRLGTINIEPKKLTCKICGIEFTWRIGEQQFYRDRRLQEPRRCPECRVKREVQRHGNGEA